MGDKITGVCVDIPTIIENAKMDRMVDNLITEKDSKWISVKERLPENSADFVIVSDRKKTTVALRYDDMWIQTGEKITITDWMPLPEPSK